LPARLQDVVEHSANAEHLILAEACRLVDQQQTVVEKLQQRWQEPDYRRNGGRQINAFPALTILLDEANLKSTLSF
jgi:hypothetical protein